MCLPGAVPGADAAGVPNENAMALGFKKSLKLFEEKTSSTYLPFFSRQAFNSLTTFRYCSLV